MAVVEVAAVVPALSAAPPPCGVSVTVIPFRIAVVAPRSTTIVPSTSRGSGVMNTVRPPAEVSAEASVTVVERSWKPSAVEVTVRLPARNTLLITTWPEDGVVNAVSFTPTAGVIVNSRSSRPLASSKQEALGQVTDTSSR